MSGAPKMTPFTTFSIIGHMLAYGLNAPHTSTTFRLRTVIKSVPWLISNGQLVAEIWSFQVLSLWNKLLKKTFATNFSKIPPKLSKIWFTLGLHAGILT
jgi:hypothetical protein